jgi:lincosamide nucleotidyltransferase A/C/D/E
MQAHDVLDLYHTATARKAPFWIDGGWAVDALLGEETRPHADLDLAIESRNLPILTTLLAARRYTDIPRDDTSPWNFVLGDPDGRLIDLHVIDIDAIGRGIYGPPEKDIFYPASALAGTGTIAGQPVRCIAPADLVKFHTGYPPRDTDIADVRRLCARFDLPLPEDFR